MTRVLLYGIMGASCALMMHQFLSSTLSTRHIVVCCILEATWTFVGILAAEALLRRRRDR